MALKAPYTPEVREHLRILADRVRYLEGRARLKRSMGWDAEHDDNERMALEFALELLTLPDDRAVLQGDDLA